MSEEDMPRSVCCGVIRRASTKEERTDDLFYYWPHMVGNCILLYGKKNSRFPRQPSLDLSGPVCFSQPH